ncbi:hypothetical protein QFC22_003647 [Naganishia vaughanmartiniae]|uniref:Uncharacterized protein n=1 Tax=Naganishia vaughanmartiniae TaxID=1424756 RepID=A0ACC2X7W6_9TREE|nr:hypothetical protein QFC22_003647 [Naganishia vaughanmartiniae]
MSKSEEKSSKRKSKDVEASVTEPKKEKKEKKDKKDKKDKTKEKKEKKVEKSDESVEAPVIAPTTEDVDMETEESPVEKDSEAPEDSSIKKRKREDKSDIKDTQDEDANLLEIDPDAPTPLSKAQARAARKEAKRKRKDGEADEEAASDVEEAGADGEPKPKKSKKDKDEAPKPPKRQHSVWIGNLAFKTNPESLKAWLEREIILLSKGGGPKAEAGEDAEVEDDDEPEEGDDDEVDEETEIVTRVNMPMKQGRFGVQNQGFAYVDFKTRRFQKLGVKLSEKMIDGRRLLIKYGDDYGAKADARTPKPVTSIPAGALPKSQPHNASATLFMGNLPFDATEEALWDFVERNAQEALKGRKKSKKGKGRKARFGEQQNDSESESGSEEEDDEEEDKEEEDVAQGDAKAILENKRQSGEVSGLRRVRMPLFEDSGKCKGFAFLDFKSVDQATLALANRRNHFLYNRKLKMQYASEGATKRSLPASQRNRPPPGEEGAEGAAPRPTGRYFDKSAPAAEGEEKKDARGKKWETAGRPKPGAALMMAKRESVAIVAGQGKKTTF